MKKAFWILLVLSIIWTLFIWSNSLKNSNQSSNQSGVVVDVVVGAIENVNKEPISEDFYLSITHFIRKCGHFTEFGVLGVLAFVTLYLFKRKKRVFFVGISYSYFIAIIDELIQKFIPGRGPSFTDTLIDLLGAITFSVVAVLVVYFMEKRAIKCAESSDL